MANSQTRLIIVLGAVLLAVIAVSAVVVLLLPSGGDIDTTISPLDTATDTTTATTGEETVPTASTTFSGGSSFDLRVLQSPAYLLLDKQLVQEGALPVQPPTGTGKANPFL